MPIGGRGRIQLGNQFVLALLFSLLVWSTLIIVFGPNRDLLTAQDFSIYWKAGQNFLEGRNPYELPPSIEYVTPGAFGYYDTKPLALKMWNPPFSLPLLIPFSAFPLSVAKHVYVVGLAFALALTCLFQFRLLAQHGFSAAKSCIVIFSGLIFGAIATTAQWGGMSWIALLLVTLILQVYAARQFFLLGVLTPLLVIKPATMFIFVAVLFLIGLRFGAKKFILGVFSSLSVIVAILLLFRPEIYSDYANLNQHIANAVWRHTESFSAAFYRLGVLSDSDFWRWVPLCIVIGAFAWFIWSRRIEASRAERLLLYALPLSVFFSPYSWTHDYIACLPFFMDVSRRIMTSVSSWQRYLGLFCLLLVHFFSLIALSLSMLFSIGVSVGVTVFLLWMVSLWLGADMGTEEGL